VRVLNVKLTPALKPDNKGLVKWDVKLAAKETKEFRIEYVLDYPTGLAQQSAMAESVTPLPSIHKQIGDLEQVLKK
jgi:hypothetical protein